jgi:cysteinyl-tRNA synthetase
LFELSHQINAFVSSADPNQAADKAVLRQAMETFSNLGGVLGIFMETATDDQQSVDNLLNIILTMRNQARQDKHYALADSLRDFLNSQEIKVEDKAGGSQFRYEKAPQIDAIMDFLVALRQDFKNTKEYNRADKLRDELKGVGITLEDTREGVRWKIVDA